VRGQAYDTRHRHERGTRYTRGKARGARHDTHEAHEAQGKAYATGAGARGCDGRAKGMRIGRGTMRTA